MECKPRGWPPGSAPTALDGLPALLQLSGPRSVILVQLQQLTPNSRRWPALPRAYQALVSHPETVLLGVHLKADAQLVHGSLSECKCALADLDEIAYRSSSPSPRAIDARWGLAALTEALGGPPLCKSKKLQLCNWARRVLKPAELEYAARDAYAAGWIAARLYESAQAAGFTSLGFGGWLKAQALLPERVDVAPGLLAAQEPLLPAALVAALAAERAAGGEAATLTKRVVARTQAGLPGIPKQRIRAELERVRLRKAAPEPSRRAMLTAACAAIAASAAPSRAAAAKRTGLSDAVVRDVLADGLRRGYFVRSSVMPVDVFADDCRFVDPTTDVRGLARYVAALDLLFDPADSSVELIDAEVVAPRTIRARWTLSGRLKLPWRPSVRPFQGTATYTLDASGLVSEQRETWEVSALEALRETFTPGR